MTQTILRCGLAALGVAVSTPAFADGYDWSGLYLAGHFQGNYADLSGRFVQPDNSLSAPSELSDVDGAAYGVSVGHNWQLGNIIVGAEGRWSASSLEQDETVKFGSIKQTRKIKDSLTLGARAGFALSNLHFYGTAGVASSGYQSVTSKVSVLGGVENQIDKTEKRLYGTYVGAGAEWAFGKNLIVGLQYDRVSLSGENNSFSDVTLDETIFESSDPTIDTVSAKFGVKF